MKAKSELNYKDYGFMTDRDIRKVFREIYGRKLFVEILYNEKDPVGPETVITLEVYANNCDHIYNSIRCTRKPEDVFLTLLKLTRRFVR